MSTVFLHHAFLHFPIGLLVGAGIIALYSFIRPSHLINKTLIIFLVFGLVSGILAGVAGLLSADHLIGEGQVTVSQMAGHRNVALFGLLFAAIGLVLFWVAKKKEQTRLPSILGGIAVILSAALMVVASDWGGRMIHQTVTPFAKEHSHESSMPHSESENGHHQDNESDHPHDSDAMMHESDAHGSDNHPTPDGDHSSDSHSESGATEHDHAGHQH
ncbi:hypothetical protein BMS3Bbin04_00365 [bacterium BMS3Bbin04]|nr:hypothetical protein BMS3Bbin04_00365 [bacterium BMS3Bbin04]